MIFNAVWGGVVAVNITNVIFDRNLVVRIIARGFSIWHVNAIMDATAGFHVCSDYTVDCTFSITSNKVFGSDFAGFIMSAAECGNPDKVNKNNKVRSANKGFLMTNSGDFNCTEVIGNIIHFTLEGLGFKGNSPQVRVSDIELIENIVGMSMRTGRDIDGVQLTISYQIPYLLAVQFTATANMLYRYGLHTTIWIYIWNHRYGCCNYYTYLENYTSDVQTNRRVQYPWLTASH